MTETVARSLQDYIDLAVGLGEDAAWRREVSDRLAAGKWRVYGDLAPVCILETLLEEWAGAVA